MGSDESFAKLFGQGKDQILAVYQTHDDDGKPEIAIFFQPPGLGVCKVSGIYDSWDKADIQWAKVDEAYLREAVAPTLAMFADVANEAKAKGGGE